MNDERKEAFKIRLKKALAAKGMKSVELSEKTGVPTSAISYYLTGRSEPRLPRMQVLAKALDVSDVWLLGYDVAMERDTEQKELDEMASIVERMKKERDFRQLILKIGQLKPQQLEAVKNLLDAFPQE